MLLALEADFAMLAARLHRAALHERVVGNHFGADESPLDVAVNFAGRLLRRRAARDRPRPALVLTDSEKGDVAEQVVGGTDNAIEARLLQPEVRKERGCIVRSELRDLEFDRREIGRASCR